MNLIQKEIQRVNFIVDQYVEDIDKYNSQSKLILKELKSIIDDLAPRFGLISGNSVRKIKSYSFSDRVKEAESLKEKFIRNNLINGFQDLLPENYNVDGVLSRTIKNKLYELDDLIGIKILTDLNIDCKKMFELIKSPEFKTKAISKGILLNEFDLREQPQIMRNGLDIYKIKGKYDQYNFELQIKSKIISAWGDMEHSIFYKDYTITPVRDTAQKSMNHVGKLLFDIDDFVESIRGANKNYEENAKALLFLSWFEKSYTEKIKGHLNNVAYRFEGIAELLFQASNILEIKSNNPINELQLNHFEIIPSLSHLINYTKNRNKSYDLKILESVILSWQLPPEQEINDDNINITLTNFIEVIVTASANYLKVIFQGYDAEELEEILKSLFEVSLLYGCNEKFLINLHKLSEYFKTCIYIDEITESIRDSSDRNKKAIEIIKTTVFIYLHNGDYKGYIDNEITTPEAIIDEELYKTNILKLIGLFPEKDNRDVIGFKKILSELINDK